MKKKTLKLENIHSFILFDYLAARQFLISAGNQSVDCRKHIESYYLNRNRIVWNGMVLSLLLLYILSQNIIAN